MRRQTSSKGFATLSAASVISKVLAFVYLPIQAMLVHDSGNGLISAGFKLYLFIYALSNAGLPVIISKFISERDELGDYRGSQVIFRTAFLITLALGIVSSLFTFFASGFLANWCGMPESKLMFMVISPTFLFASVGCSIRGYFQGKQDMMPTAISQIVEQIINSLFTALLEILFFRYAMQANKDTVTYTAAGSAAATVMAAVGSTAFLAFLYFVVFRKQRDREYFKQKYEGPGIKSGFVLKQMLMFTVPAIISCIATSAADIIDTKSCIPLLLKGGYSASQAYSLFGIYSTKYQRLMTLPVLFVTPLVTAIMPSLSAAKSRGDYEYFNYMVNEGYRLNFMVVMPIIAGLSFLAKPILTVIFTMQNAGSLMIILGTWMALLTTVQALQSGILIALDRPLISPLTLIIGMAAKTILNYILIPFYSINIYGALIGNAIAWIISIVVNQYYINKKIKKGQPLWKYISKPGISAITMGGLCLGFYTILFSLINLISNSYLLINDLSVLFTVPFGSIVYFVIMIKIGSINTNDLKRLPKGNMIVDMCTKIPFLRSALNSA